MANVKLQELRETNKNKKRLWHQGRCPHYTGKTTNNESGLSSSIDHDKPQTLNALLSAMVSHWAKEQIALDLTLTFYSIHSATPGWATLLSPVSFICFPILGWQLASLSVLAPPKSLNKWDAVDMNLRLTFITPHKVIVPTYGWTNKESPFENPSALSTNPWKYTSSTQKERSFQQPPFSRKRAVC